MCDWSYERHHYCVVVYNDEMEPQNYYYSKGINDLSDEEQDYLTMMGEGGEEGITLETLEAPFTLEDDDSVMHMSYKMGVKLNKRHETLYFWIEDEQPYNMGYDLIYNIDGKHSRKFAYVARPSDTLDESIASPADWKKHVKHYDFRSALLEKYEYHMETNKEIRYIHCIAIDDYADYIKDEAGASASYLMKIYYPQVTDVEVKKLYGKRRDDVLTKLLDSDDDPIKSMKDIITVSTRAVHALNDDHLYAEATELNDKSEHKIVFGVDNVDGVCNISEAVVHINYNEQNDEFVDLLKIFHMVKTTRDIPYIRYFSDREKAPRYKIFHSMTDKKSDIYITQKALQEWINPKLNKITDRSNIHEIMKESKAITGRGLSIKMRHYVDSSGEVRYYNVSIYKDGKIDIKCAWDEQFHVSSPESPGGNQELLTKILTNVRKVIVSLNKLQYSLPGSRKKTITPPATALVGHANTRVAFYNIISTFDFNGVIDRKELIDYWKKYSASHIVLIERETPTSGIDTRSFEFRYKRLHNYIHLTSIDRTINQYLKDNAEDFTAKTEKKILSENVKKLVKFVSSVYSIADTQSRKAYDAYAETHGAGVKQKRGRSIPGISNKTVSLLLKRSLDKQAGIAVKVLKRYPNVTDAADPKTTKYKCLIYGVSPTMLGKVIYFLRRTLLYYRHNQDILDPKFQELLGLEVNIAPTIEPYNLMKPKDESSVADKPGKKPTGQPGTTTSPIKTVGPVAGKLESDSSESESSESSSDDSDDDPEYQSPEPLPEVQTETPAAKPAAKKAKPQKTGPSHYFITRLKDRWGDKYAGKTYSSQCQHSAGRQPVAISEETKKKLQAFVTRETEATSKALKKLKKGTPDHDDKLLYQAELSVHKTQLDTSLLYDGLVHMCPFTWDYLAEVTGWEANFPRFRADGKGGTFSNIPKKDAWNAANKTKWIAGKKVEALTKFKKPTTGIRVLAPHHWYISFLPKSGTECKTCCFKTQRKPKGEDLRKLCIEGKTSKGKAPNPTAVSYILNQTYTLAQGRLGRIPADINTIFNPDDKGYLVTNGNANIGFNQYLRQGVNREKAHGNKFLNAVNLANPKIKNVIETIIEYIEGPDRDSIFKSLKRGSMYHLFTPIAEGEDDSDSEEGESDKSDSSSDKGDSGSALQFERFKKYLRSQEGTVNENLLWDVLSAPGVLLSTGLNIVICEATLGGKRGNDFELGQIMCPRGFEISTLYDISRPTIILYKYAGNNYEVITKVESRVTKSITKTVLLKAGHNLAEEIFEYINIKCVPIPNIIAKLELKKHISNVSKKQDILDTVLLADSITMDLDRAVELLSSVTTDGVSGYNIETQVIDNYNKVTHIILSDGYWIPVEPSGINVTLGLDIINMDDVAEDELPEVGDLVTQCLFLNKFYNFVGYMPYAFLIDPGEDLNDPDDDIIIGLILNNGLITYTKELPVAKLGGNGSRSVDPEITVSHPIGDYGLDDEPFDMKQLLFAAEERAELWYDDYRAADKVLAKKALVVNDFRKVYALRSNYEYETYQRLRYELTKLLATEEHHDIRDNINEIIDRVNTINVEKTLAEARVVMIEEIKLLLADYITHTADKLVIQGLGPVDKPFDALTDKDIASYKYDYVRPNVRYQCSNPKLESFQENNLHCRQIGTARKIYVPSANLLTGNPNNYDNYIARITEELLRIPLKRHEIINDEIDNFISDVFINNKDEYYLNATNVEDLYTDIQKMYTSDVNYNERMKRHYDVVNPMDIKTAAYRDSLEKQHFEDCRSTYVNLPAHWNMKLKTMNWKRQKFIGGPKCVFKELNKIIANYYHSIGPLIDVNVRNEIAQMIGSSEFESVEDRQGWELVRDYYASRKTTTYQNLTTKHKLLELIRISDKHYISHLELSLISKRHNIKFIIITRPNAVTPDGIVCLGTTQTVADPGRYMIFYLENLDTYSIVKDTSSSPAKAIFEEHELPEALHKSWIEKCIDDTAATTDPINYLFAKAPRPGAHKKHKPTAKPAKSKPATKPAKLKPVTKPAAKPATKPAAKPSTKPEHVPSPDDSDSASLTDYSYVSSPEAAPAPAPAKSAPKKFDLKKIKALRAKIKPVRPASPDSSSPKEPKPKPKPRFVKPVLKRPVKSASPVPSSSSHKTPDDTASGDEVSADSDSVDDLADDMDNLTL